MAKELAWKASGHLCPCRFESCPLRNVINFSGKNLNVAVAFKFSKENLLRDAF